jgi:hypothetical protein
VHGGGFCCTTTTTTLYSACTTHMKFPTTYDTAAGQYLTQYTVVFVRIEISEYLEEDETSILYGVRVLIRRILPDCTSSRFSAAFSEKSARVFSQLPRD